MQRPFIVALAALGFSASLTAIAPRPATAEEVKIGYVDFQRALAETEDGRKATGQLKKMLETKQKELDEQQEELKKAFEDLQKKRTLLQADVVRQKEAELQERLQKVQNAYLRNQQELAGKENEFMAPIVDRMNRIVTRMAQTENFTVVLEKSRSGLVFAKGHLDLTNELIRRYNAGEGAGGAPATGGAKPAPGAKPAAPAAAAPKK